jgi:hypothetical protein
MGMTQPSSPVKATARPARLFAQDVRGPCGGRPVEPRPRHPKPIAASDSGWRGLVAARAGEGFRLVLAVNSRGGQEYQRKKPTELCAQ